MAYFHPTSAGAMAAKLPTCENLKVFEPNIAAEANRGALPLHTHSFEYENVYASLDVSTKGMRARGREV